MNGQPNSAGGPHSTLTPEPPGWNLRTGLATTSLVMGILGLIACPVVGLAAFVTGIIALLHIRREPSRYGGRGMAISGMTCGGISAFVIGPFMLLIILPILRDARDSTRRLACAVRLQSISTALTIYGSDYEGQGVPTIARLVELDLLDSKMTRCPNAPVPNYVIHRVMQDGLPDDAVLVSEPKSNHEQKGGNVLRADRQIQFMGGAEYDRMLERSR